MAQSEQQDNLTLVQRNAITALLQSRDVASASRACGVPTRTLYNWMENKEFKAELSSAEAQMLKSIARRLGYLSNASLDVLVAILADKTTPPGVKVSATRVILESFLRLKEIVSLEERLTALEAVLLDSDPAKEIIEGEKGQGHESETDDE